MSTTSQPSYGQIAYESYMAETNLATPWGADCVLQHAWKRAAHAVLSTFLEREGVTAKDLETSIIGINPFLADRWIAAAKKLNALLRSRLTPAAPVGTPKELLVPASGESPATADNGGEWEEFEAGQTRYQEGDYYWDGFGWIAVLLHTGERSRFKIRRRKRAAGYQNQSPASPPSAEGNETPRTDAAISQAVSYTTPEYDPRWTKEQMDFARQLEQKCQTLQADDKCHRNLIQQLKEDFEKINDDKQAAMQRQVEAVHQLHSSQKTCAEQAKEIERLKQEIDPQRKEQANAWLGVSSLLMKLYPGCLGQGQTGLAGAIITIQRSFDELQSLRALANWTPISTLPKSEDADRFGRVLYLTDHEVCHGKWDATTINHWLSYPTHWRPTNLPAPEPDKADEAFEKWLAENYPPASQFHGPYSKENLKKCWQAAQAALAAKGKEAAS